MQGESQPEEAKPWLGEKIKGEIFFAEEKYNEAIEAYEKAILMLKVIDEKDHDNACRYRAEYCHLIGNCLVKQASNLLAFEQYIAAINCVLAIKEKKANDVDMIILNCSSLKNLHPTAIKPVNGYLKQLFDFSVNIFTSQEQIFSQVEAYENLITQFNQNEVINKSVNARECLRLLQTMIIKCQYVLLPSVSFKEWLQTNKKQFIATLIIEDGAHCFCYENAIQLHQEAGCFSENKDTDKAYHAYKKTLDEHNHIDPKARKDKDHRLRAHCYYQMAVICYKPNHRNTKSAGYYTRSLASLVRVVEIEKKDADEFFLAYTGFKQCEPNGKIINVAQTRVLDFYSEVFSGSEKARPATYEKLLAQQLNTDQNDMPNEYSLAWWLMHAVLSTERKGRLPESPFRNWLTENQHAFISKMDTLQKSYKRMKKKSQQQSTPAPSPRSSSGLVPTSLSISRLVRSFSFREPEPRLSEPPAAGAPLKKDKNSVEQPGLYHTSLVPTRAARLNKTQSFRELKKDDDKPGNLRKK